MKSGSLTVQNNTANTAGGLQAAVVSGSLLKLLVNGTAFLFQNGIVCGVFYKNKKFVAAKSTYNIAGAEGLGKCSAYGLQERIAGVVAEFIVYLFKIV